MRKLFLVCFLVGLMGCSTYQASISGDGKRVAVAQNKWFLFVTWGKVFVCDVNDKEMLNCRQEKEKIAKAEKKPAILKKETEAKRQNYY